MKALVMAAIAALVVTTISGCGTTQANTSAPVGSSSMAAITGQSTPQCVAGWHACVCDKDAKCCSPRLDCSCSGGGTSGTPSCS